MRLIPRVLASLRLTALAGGLAVACVASACAPSAHAPRVPRDPMLRALPIFLYPARETPPCAVVFFFGNDVGFWRAHQELAERLVRQGYAVAGFDVRKWMERLPDAPWQARDSAFAAGIRPIMSRAVAELAPGGAPVVVAGHSTGAEIALWTAAHAPPAGMAGVLVMSPGGRGHLRITLADLANAGDPTDAGSFDVPAQVAALPPSMRVALVRGQHDQYRYADSAFAADGGDRYRHLLVPLAGHSMKSLFVAGPAIETGLAWVLARRG